MGSVLQVLVSVGTGWGRLPWFRVDLHGGDVVEAGGCLPGIFWAWMVVGRRELVWRWNLGRDFCGVGTVCRDLECCVLVRDRFGGK